MTLIDGDRIITAQLYDDEHEEFTEKKMSIIDYVNAFTDEGVTEEDVVVQTDVPVTNVGELSCILDKIRDKIIAEADYEDEYDDQDIAKGLYKAVDIIDKCMESGEE